MQIDRLVLALLVASVVRSSSEGATDGALHVELSPEPTPPWKDAAAPTWE